MDQKTQDDAMLNYHKVFCLVIILKQDAFVPTEHEKKSNNLLKLNKFCVFIVESTLQPWQNATMDESHTWQCRCHIFSQTQ